MSFDIHVHAVDVLALFINHINTCIDKSMFLCIEYIDYVISTIVHVVTVYVLDNPLSMYFLPD